MKILLKKHQLLGRPILRTENPQPREQRIYKPNNRTAALATAISTVALLESYRTIYQCQYQETLQVYQLMLEKGFKTRLPHHLAFQSMSEQEKQLCIFEKEISTLWRL